MHKIIISLLLASLAICSLPRETILVYTAEAAGEQQAIIFSETPKIDPRQELLAKCESGNNPLAINPHDGGSASYGKYQWKEESFYQSNKKYKVLPDLERGEVMNVIYNESVQDRLTTLVLKEKNGWRKWYSCGLKSGLDKI